jgi:hypothetical protein
VSADTRGRPADRWSIASIRRALPEGYPLGPVTLYLVLLTILLVVRASVGTAVFADLAWIVVIAAVPLLPWLVSRASTIVSKVKLGEVEITFAEVKATTRSANQIARLNESTGPDNSFLTFTNHMTSRVGEMTQWIVSLRETRAEAVPVDLGSGDRWVLPNLYLLSLLLEVKTVVARLVFTEVREGRPNQLIGSCSPFDLRLELDKTHPELERAKHATPLGPLEQVGPTFFQRLHEQVPHPATKEQYAPWVTGSMLYGLLGRVLDDHTYVEINHLTQAGIQRATLPLDQRFIPVVADGALVSIIDQYRVALTTARQTLAKE